MVFHQPPKLIPEFAYPLNSIFNCHVYLVARGWDMVKKPVAAAVCVWKYNFAKTVYYGIPWYTEQA